MIQLSDLLILTDFFLPLPLDHDKTTISYTYVKFKYLSLYPISK